ncbi:MAG: TolC family protein [Phycisphaerales bacterium]|nr:TolC family protein [Phycisphaerales bacterium]
MNNQTGRGRDVCALRKWTGAIAALASIVFVGCAANPFATLEHDYGLQVDSKRWSVVDKLDMAPMQRELEPYEQATTGTDATPQTPPDPFANIDRLPITIEQCRQWAIENNLDLRVSLIDPVIADQSLSEEEAAFESIVFARASRSDSDSPTASTLSGSQTSNRQFEPGVRVPLRTGGQVELSMPINRFETDNSFSFLNPSWTSDLQFSISQPLLRGAGRRSSTAGIRIASLGAQATRARTKLEVIRTLADAERSYWDLYAAWTILDVRRQEYELAMEQLERARRRVEAGDAPDVEIIRAQSGLAERLRTIIVAENSVRLNQRNLKRIINVPGLDVGSTTLLVIESTPDPVPYSINGEAMADAALAQRMELLELELQLAQDVTTIDLRKNEQLPLFSVDYTYRYNGLGGSFRDAQRSMRSLDFADWTLSARFEAPLGNEAAEARTHQAILRRLQRLGTKAAREQSIREEVFNAVDALDAAWQLILASRQATVLAKRTLDAETNQFRVGLRTSTDVLDAATNLADAQSSEAAAIASYQNAQVDLAFATGTLLGAAKVSWTPVDPRSPDDWVGERAGSGVDALSAPHEPTWLDGTPRVPETAPAPVQGESDPDASPAPANDQADAAMTPIEG